MKKRTRFLVSFSLFVCVGLCFFSCSKNKDSASFMTTLDEIDRCIEQHEVTTAIKLLSKIEKKAYSAQYVIGVYKRYMQLSEKKRAEKILKFGIKHNPQSLELCALYTSFLTRENRISEALKVGHKLARTEYGSIYSEAFFKDAIQKQDEPFSYFIQKELLDTYYDAYVGSKDNAWLRNVALLYMLYGQYTDAASLNPSEKKSASDAYFWSEVLFDAGLYAEASDALLVSRDLLERESLGQTELVDTTVGGAIKEKRVSIIEITSLLSDAYVCIGEDEEAEKVRNDLIASLTSENDLEGSSSELLAIMYLNSALYSLSKNDYTGAGRLLTFVVQKWPDFIPGLVAYGNYAYNSNRLIMDDPLTRSAREAGVQSIDMKRFDDIPRVPISDALLRMEDALSKMENGGQNSVLYVAKLDLEDKISTETDERVRLSKMWRVLERNTVSHDQYPPEIAKYAVHTLLTLEKQNDAKTLFRKYLCARYNFDTTKNFYDECAEHLLSLYVWEAEYAAFFAALDKDATTSKRIYEYVVYETGYTNGGQEISPNAALSSSINLAMIYSSTKKSDKALELYGRAQSHATDNFTKADIMYRIACIQNTRGLTTDAIKSLQYSLYLNPSYARARILLNKIKI